jgi:hypothetical protein
MNATDKIDAARIELLLGELRLPGTHPARTAFSAQRRHGKRCR